MKKVLIVDDSRTIITRLAYSIQEKLNVEVIQAESKQRCHERLLKYKKFDIALLDLNLPDAQGNEIVDLVSKYNIPIIVLSGDESNINNNILENKNVIDYIIKDRSYAIEQAVNMTKRFLNNKNHTIMIVDDSKTYSLKIEDTCKKYNLNTIVVNNSEDALDIVKNNQKIKLIFVDYYMPKMNGLELTSQLRKKYSSDEIAIIALSASNDKETIPKFLKFGANDYIDKSSSIEEIVARLMVNLNTIELFEEAKEKANKDFLTGLYNRRYLFDEGFDLYKKNKKNKNILTTAVLDIDYFKKINDTYGHDIGDLVIKELSKNLQKYMPKDSLIARLGGEEFCVLIPNIKKDVSKKALEMFRTTIEKQVMEIDNISFNYTISIGLTTEYKNSLEEMLKVADEALYKAKTAGRNKTISI
ncbi:MAG: diguanylate cyclase [Halarcobacter sp.]